jgi:hypothetical protein
MKKIQYSKIPVGYKFVRACSGSVVWVKTFGLWAVKLDQQNKPGGSVAINATEMVTKID